MGQKWKLIMHKNETGIIQIPYNIIGADTAENSWKFPKKVLKKDPKIGPNRTKKGPFSVVLGSQRGLFSLSSLFPSKKSTNNVQNWFSGY